MASQLAKALSKGKVDRKVKKPKELLVPLVDKFLLSQGDNAEWMSERCIEIATDLFHQMNARQDERRARKVFSASGAYGCMRAQELDTRGLNRIPITDYKLINIFHDGNWRNAKWICIFELMGLLKQYEVTQLKKKYNVAGTPDAELDLSLYYDHISDVGVEIKGMHNREYNAFINNDHSSRWGAGRILQVNTYMLITGAKFWIIWAENKETQEYAEQIIYRNDVIIDYLIKRYRYQLEARSMQALPAIECEMNNTDKIFARCRQNKNCSKMLQQDYPTISPMKNRQRLARNFMKELK